MTSDASNGAWTAGPWIVSRTVEGKLAVKTKDENDKFAICTFAGFRKRQLEDARLIASAPELIEVLAEIIKAHDAYSETPIGSSEEEDTLVALDSAIETGRAALAKATGEISAQSETGV